MSLPSALVSRPRTTSRCPTSSRHDMPRSANSRTCSELVATATCCGTAPASPAPSPPSPPPPSSSEAAGAARTYLTSVISSL